MQSRFYMPEIGRFLQPDTIVPDPADPQSLNRYSYVLNNPLRYTDPTGREYIPSTDVSYCLLGLGGGCQETSPNIPPGWLVSTGGECLLHGTCLPGEAQCATSHCDLSGFTAVGEFVLQVLPGTGDVLDACMFLSGRDCLTWERVPTWQQLLALGSFASPIGFARYGDEGLDALQAAGRGARGADGGLEIVRASDAAVNSAGRAVLKGSGELSVTVKSSKLSPSHRYGWVEQRYVQYYDRVGRRVATVHEVLTVDKSSLVTHRHFKEAIDYSSGVRYIGP